MKCPTCGLENPPSALWCDCGHAFGRPQWYYIDGTERRGPVPTDDLIASFRSGAIPLDASVWCPGMTAWMPASSVSELAQAVPPAVVSPRVSGVALPVPPVGVSHTRPSSSTVEPGGHSSNPKPGARVGAGIGGGLVGFIVIGLATTGPIPDRLVAVCSILGAVTRLPTLMRSPPWRWTKVVWPSMVSGMVLPMLIFLVAETLTADIAGRIIGGSLVQAIFAGGAVALLVYAWRGPDVVNLG